MFIGHFAVGFAAKRVAPGASLGTLFLAAQFIDLLWPLLLLFGLERVRIVPGITAMTPLDFEHYPWSHSLLMVAVTGLAAGGLYWLFTGRRNAGGATLVALLALSHWVLDWVTHQPDLPLYPGGSARLGLGLWNSPAATLVIEGLMWVGGIALYLKATRPLDRTGRVVFWSLIALLTFIYAGNLTSPPPANLSVLAWAAMVGWLVPFWGAWADRHRAPVGAEDGAAS